MNQAFDGGKMGHSRGMVEEHHPTDNIGVVQRWGDTPSDGILRDFDMENDEPLDFPNTTFLGKPKQCEPRTLKITTHVSYGPFLAVGCRPGTGGWRQIVLAASPWVLESVAM